MRYRLIALAVLATSACATMGTKFDMTRVRQLEPGISTLADATKALGNPTNETYEADGSVIVLWMYSTGTALGTGKSEYVSILFERERRMVRLLQHGGTTLH